MNIAIDFDDTYTRDPVTWDKMVHLLRVAGHNVYCVTWRSKEQDITKDFDYGNPDWTDIIYCDLKAKKKVCQDRGIYIDVWCDDNPGAVLFDYSSGYYET